MKDTLGQRTSASNFSAQTQTASDASVQLKTDLAGKSIDQQMLQLKPEAPVMFSASKSLLRMGSQGAEVEALQKQLNANGAELEPDGAFGPATRAAVVKFQQEHGLAPDGVVGNQTWGALNSKAGGKEPAPADKGAETTDEKTTTPPDTTKAEQPTNTTTPADKENASKETPTPETEDKDKPISGSRAAIVATARGELGKVHSYLPGDKDETGKVTRQGWERLMEYFVVAYEGGNMPHPDIIKYVKHGKNYQGPDKPSNPNGLPSWCGLFATWAVKTAGVSVGAWRQSGGVNDMKRITTDPQPGDVGYFTANQHHCIIASVDGDQIETIDGNSAGTGAVTSKMRSRSSFAGFFKMDA